MAYLGTGSQTSSGGGAQASNITQIGGSSISLGQKTMANSFPVVIASDQSTLNVALAANQSVNVAQWGGTTLGTPTNFGTTPTAVIAGSVNASIFAGTTALTQTGSALDVNLKTSGLSNQSVNVAQIAGNTTSTAASGTQLVGIADGAGNKLTTNSTTYTSKFGLDSNLLGTLGTAFSTAGKVDVKGADGDVFVRQATASNLKATVNIQGNTGAAMDAAGQNVASPANELLVGAQFNTTPTTISSGNMSPLQFGNSKGFLGEVIMDAAGNIRGANVNASNQLSVSLDGGTGSTVTLGAGSATIGALTANQSVNINQVSGSAVSTAASGVMKVGIVGNAGAIFDGATAASVPANVLYEGARGTTALPTAVTDGQLVGDMADKFGRQIVVTDTVRDLKSNITPVTLNNSTTETTLIGQVAATFLDITSIVVVNTSATATRLDFRDSTAGTIQFAVFCPATDTRGISNVFFKQTTVNNNWTVQSSASISDVRIYGTYVSNK